MLVGVVGIALGDESASAADDPNDGLLLSADGVHFAPSYSGELFHELGAMVPGDSQTGHFWVRNGTSRTAYLRIGISGVTAENPVFLQSFTVETVLAGVAAVSADFDFVTDAVEVLMSLAIAYTSPWVETAMARTSLRPKS